MEFSFKISKAFRLNFNLRHDFALLKRNTENDVHLAVTVSVINQNEINIEFVNTLACRVQTVISLMMMIQLISCFDEVLIGAYGYIFQALFYRVSLSTGLVSGN